MDIPHFCKLFYFQIVFLLLITRCTYGRVYSVKSKQPRQTSGIGRPNDPSGPEVYISDLWKSALNRNTPTKKSKKGVMLSPNNGPGTGIVQLLSKQEPLSKHAFSVLSSGIDDDTFDLNNSHGKILNFHDKQKGPVSILKSPGSSSSVLLAQRGGSSFRRKGNEPSVQKKLQSIIKALVKKQASSRNLSDINQNTGYVGPLTSILAETICPFCRRISNSRVRVSCLLRFCLENPNISTRNPR